MRTIDLGTEAMQVDTVLGSVVIEPEPWGKTRVRVVADKGAIVTLGPPYPLTGHELTIEATGGCGGRV